MANMNVLHTHAGGGHAVAPRTGDTANSVATLSPEAVMQDDESTYLEIAQTA
jgi:hypothetical protein